MNTLYNYLWFFAVYAVLGWCAEVAYAAVKRGKFVNRGFLNGPVCPIYGFGMVLIIFALSPIKNNIFLLFIGATVLTTALEFITGFILEKLYNQRWWDYSENRFNIGGYICLKFSILWGTAGTVLIALVHPFIAVIIGIIPNWLGWIVISVVITLFVIDFSLTSSYLARFAARTKKLKEIGAELKKLSDTMGENLYEAVKRGDNIKERLEELSESSKEKTAARFSELNRRREELAEKRSRIYERLERAYPNLKKRR